MALIGIGNGDDATGFAIEGKKERCCTLAPQRVGLDGQRTKIDADIFHEFGVSKRDGMTVDRTGHAFAGDRGEICRVLECERAVARGRDDRRGERMFA